MKLEAKHIMMENDNTSNVHVWFLRASRLCEKVYYPDYKSNTDIRESFLHYDRFNM